jgi:hypothetical protein
MRENLKLLVASQLIEVKIILYLINLNEMLWINNNNFWEEIFTYFPFTARTA